MATRDLQNYKVFVSEIQQLLETARRQAARSVNAILTATYWEVGRRIIEYNQKGEVRAKHGESLLENLAQDLTKKFWRGFSRQNIQQMREFYLAYSPHQICQTPSGKSNLSVRPHVTDTFGSAIHFPLSWSHYVRLLSLKNENAHLAEP